jgi:hypothetical protein
MLSDQDHVTAMFVYVGSICCGFGLFGSKEPFLFFVFIAGLL